MRAMRTWACCLAALLAAGCGAGGKEEEEPAALAIATSSLPGGKTGVAYSAQVSSTGGTAPCNWWMYQPGTYGDLPPGLSLNASTGVISGTPTTQGSWTFTVGVSDSSVPAQSTWATFSIAVGYGSLLAITTTSLPGGTTGVAYSAPVAATGGTGPYAWSLYLPGTYGSLPPGLSLEAATGVISGTPTTQGSWNFTVQVSDASLPAQTTHASLTISVSYASILTITTTSLPGGTTGVAYGAPVAVTGGTGPYAWSLYQPGTYGDLPPGLSLDAATGVISGTPTTQGSWNFTVQVSDASLPMQTTHASLTINVNYASILTITTTSLPGGTTGVAYSAPVSASGGTGPYAWSLYQPGTYGDLPPGLSLNASTGVISGTPTTQGSWNFAVQVSDASLPMQTTYASLTIDVSYASILTITTTSLPDGTTGVAYSAPVSATGGTGPYAWSLYLPGTYGSLPPGLSLEAATGVISGTPTTQGSWNFTVQVSDASLPVQTTYASLTINVNYASLLTITTTSLPDGATGVAYSAPVSATGGTVPYAWSLYQPGTYGDLPPGLSLDAATGVISGTPTTQGSWNFTVQVSDASLPAQTTYATLGITVP
jgi:hypothetical protein